MRDFLTIIIAERRTLFRGLTISFLLVLPFTFLPILKNGFIWETIIQRLPLSVSYAFGFSFIVVIAAVIHNYNNLVDRKMLFDKPAFTKLDFYGMMDGIGSIVSELETFLLGKVGQYYFRLNIIDPDQKTIKVEMVPLIDLEGNKELKTKLKKEYGFRQDLFFGLMTEATHRDLQNENFLLDKLLKLEATLKGLEAKALDIDEKILQE
jgi:hypothetical protein